MFPLRRSKWRVATSRRAALRHGSGSSKAISSRPLGAERYDLILTNPPYVDAEAMADLPPEYRHEPALALAGGADGLAIVRRILGQAAAHLTETGGLLCEIGTGRERLEADFPDLPFLWLDTEDSTGEVFWLAAAALQG